MAMSAGCLTLASPRRCCMDKSMLEVFVACPGDYGTMCCCLTLNVQTSDVLSALLKINVRGRQKLCCTHVAYAGKLSSYYYQRYMCEALVSLSVCNLRSVWGVAAISGFVSSNKYILDEAHLSVN